MAPVCTEIMQTAAERRRRRCLSSVSTRRRSSIDQGHSKLVPERDVLPRPQQRLRHREMLRCTTSAPTGPSPLPFVAICDPFCEPIRKVDASPLRCPHCGAYVNTYCHAEPDGLSNSADYECALCLGVFSAAYYRDRSILTSATLDFMAPPEVDASRPCGVPQTPLACAFVVDVQSLPALLDSLRNEASTCANKACLIVYDDSHCHFCTDRIISVSLDDVFVPCSSEDLLKPLSHFTQKMANTLRSTFACTAENRNGYSSARGSEALTVGIELLEMVGGGVALYIAQEPPLRVPSSEECIDKCVSVYAFCGKDTLSNSLSELCTDTGGKLLSAPFVGKPAPLTCRRSVPTIERRTRSHEFPTNACHIPRGLSDGNMVESSPSVFQDMLTENCSAILRQWLEDVRESRLAVVMRLRVSRGWKIVESPWKTTDSCERACMRDESTMAFQITQDPAENVARQLRHCYLQMVVLFTDPHSGERLLRVHTHAVPVVHSTRAVYLSAHCEALANVLTRIPVKSQREEMASSWVYSYWQLCVDRKCPSNQRFLCLPPSLELLPYYVLGMRKRWQALKWQDHMSIRRSSAMLAPISVPCTMLCRDKIGSDAPTVLCDSDKIYVILLNGQTRDDPSAAHCQALVEEAQITWNIADYNVKWIDNSQLPPDWLVEDPTVSDLDYVSFVRRVHKEILYKIS